MTALTVALWCVAVLSTIASVLSTRRSLLMRDADRRLLAIITRAEQLAEPVHEVQCPQCGATIRARMADAPGDVEAVEPPRVCSKCGTAGCIEDAESGWYDDPITPVPFSAGGLPDFDG